MTPELFAKQWISENDKLINFSSEVVDQLNVSETTKEFLKTGLPEQAAPFLNFGPSVGANLESANKMFNLGSEFDIYGIIGFNTYGDPICINTQNENIIYLNHDDEFGWIYINKTLEALLECILLYREFMQYTLSHSKLESRKKAILTRNIFLGIDDECLRNGFWEVEFRELLINFSYREIIKSLFIKST